MLSDEPFAPVPSTDQDWSAPSTTGAEIVTAEALAPTTMPAERIVKALVVGVPGPTDQEVTPDGLSLNLSPATVKFASRVVVKTVPTSFVASVVPK